MITRARTSQLRHGLVAALGLVALTATAACNDSSNGGLGPVTLALSLPGGVTITSVDWKVFSPGSATAVASGTINTSNASATPSVNLSLPQGSGYTVNMTTTTSDGSPCSGTSAAFNVSPGAATVPVGVTIACGNVTPTPSVGQIVVTGTVVAGDNCPALTSSVISPETTAANGGTIDVSVAASDADSGETLSYAWAATAGSFASASQASTQYVCGAAGDQTLSVTITDSHAPAACAIHVTFPVVHCL